MRVHIVEDYKEMSCKAARIITEEIRNKPDLMFVQIHIANLC